MINPTQFSKTKVSTTPCKRFCQAEMAMPLTRLAENPCVMRSSVLDFSNFEFIVEGNFTIV
jgi:hypothetical protein